VDRPSLRYLTVDDLINYAATKWQSRRVRFAAAVVGLVVTAGIVAAPLVLQSDPAPAVSNGLDPATLDETLHETPTTVHLPSQQLAAPERPRIGPPLTTTTTSPPTTAPAAVVPAAPAPTFPPATAAPATAPPPPPPTAPPATTPDTPPDTGIAVPT
jgi:hypothetical protein